MISLGAHTVSMTTLWQPPGTITLRKLETQDIHVGTYPHAKGGQVG